MTDQFIYSWQHFPEHIKPYIFEIGSFQLRYYGLMYIVAFTIVYLLSLYRLKIEIAISYNLSSCYLHP